MKSISFFLLILLLISCDFSKQNPRLHKDSDGTLKILIDNNESIGKMKKLPIGDYFSLNLQYSHFENDRIEEKGISNLSEIQNEFKSYPWRKELDKIFLGQGKTNPTLSIIDHSNKREYSISLVGFDGFDFEFWMFLISEDGMITKEGKTVDDVYNAISLFYTREMDDFNKIFNKSPKVFKYK